MTLSVNCEVPVGVEFRSVTSICIGTLAKDPLKLVADSCHHTVRPAHYRKDFPSDGHRGILAEEPLAELPLGTAFPEVSKCSTLRARCQHENRKASIR